MRILCLGASTTDQATQSWPDTWCALLAAKLDAALDGPPIEAAAYGRGGMGVEQAVVELRRLLAGFRPDIVVVLLGVNDMTWGRRGEHAAGQTPSVDGQDCTGSSAAAPDGPARASDPSSLDPCPEAHPVGIGRAGGRDPRVAQRESARHPRALRPAPSRNPRRGPAGADRFAQGIGQLIELARSTDADVLLLGQPVIWKQDLSAEEQARLWFPVRTQDGFVRASPAWMLREMRRLNAAQREVAETRGAIFVDLEGRVPKDLEHFLDDCHLTDRGSVRVADEIAPAALELIRERVARRKRARPATAAP